MAKHTPGPWRINSRVSTAVEAPEGWGICSTGGYQTNMMDPGLLQEIHEANARLIARAPEMLEALKALLPVLEEHLDDVVDLSVADNPLHEIVSKARALVREIEEGE